MILYEYEGKKLLAEAGILVPKSQLIDTNFSLKNDDLEILKQAARLEGPRLQRTQSGKRVVLKAQVLSGKRADAGGIVMVDELSAVSSQLSDMFNKTINKERVEKVLIEEKVDVLKEFYLALSYDTDSRSPVLAISESGGTGIEGRGVKTYPIDILNPEAVGITLGEDGLEIPEELVKKIVNLFFAQDCLLLEINPLVLTKDGQWMALDA